MRNAVGLDVIKESKCAEAAKFFVDRSQVFYTQWMCHRVCSSNATAHSIKGSVSPLILKPKRSPSKSEQAFFWRVHSFYIFCFFSDVPPFSIDVPLLLVMSNCPICAAIPSVCLYFLFGKEGKDGTKFRESGSECVLLFFIFCWHSATACTQSGEAIERLFNTLPSTVFAFTFGFFGVWPLCFLRVFRWPSEETCYWFGVGWMF